MNQSNQAHTSKALREIVPGYEWIVLAAQLYFPDPDGEQLYSLTFEGLKGTLLMNATWGQIVEFARQYANDRDDGGCEFPSKLG